MSGSGLYIWMQKNSWEATIPYVLKTAIVSEEVQEVQDAIPVTNIRRVVTQNIEVRSEDIDKICEELKEHVNNYIEFVATLMGIVISVVCVAVPLFNYVFVQKETVDKLKGYGDKIHDEFVQNKEEIDEIVEELKKSIADAETQLTKARDELKKLNDYSKQHQNELERLSEQIVNKDKAIINNKLNAIPDKMIHTVEPAEDVVENVNLGEKRDDK